MKSKKSSDHTDKQGQGSTRSPKGLRVENLEGRLNLSSLWGSIGAASMFRGSPHSAAEFILQSRKVASLESSETTTSDPLGATQTSTATDPLSSTTTTTGLKLRSRPTRTFKPQPITVTDPTTPVDNTTTSTTTTTTTDPTTTPTTPTSTTTTTDPTTSNIVTVTTDTNNQNVPTVPSTPVTTVSSGVVLIPGSGFTGVTAQPGQIGTGTASTENAIARWDVVPYQTFDKTFNVGVTAFHINGIDRVEFSVNGGAWTAVTKATLNPETGVVEYWATLDASKFAQDGAVEVRAVVYPKAGVARVLQGMTGDTLEASANDGTSSLMLNTNANHTLKQSVRYVSMTGNDTTGDGSAQNPFASIKAAALSIQNTDKTADGATIYLMQGSYSIQCPMWWEGNPATANRWLTITRAPGTNKSDVIITGSSVNSQGGDSGIGTKLLKIQGVTLTGSVQGSAWLFNQGKISAMWYDDVSSTGTDRLTSVSPFGIHGPQGSNLRYATHVSIDTMDDGFNGWTMVRDASVMHTAGGAFRNVGLVLNSTVTDINNLGHGEIHPDVYQHSVGTPNAIAYGITATDAAFIRINDCGVKDMAMVNCSFQANTPYSWELGSSYQNVYVLNSTFNPGISTYSSFTPVDVVFEGNTFSGMPALTSGLLIK